MKGLKQNKTLILVGVILAIAVCFSIINIATSRNTQDKKQASTETFRIIASSENQDLEDIVKEYAKQKKYNIEIDYAGTLDIMQMLNANSTYDAVWVSNSIWLYMVDDAVNITNSKYTNINPVIFAITKSKAQELGFIDTTVYTKDIVNAIAQGKLKFSMSNPTSTNSGATAYLGLLSTLAGNPEVLKKEDLQKAELKEQITTLFTGLERSSGSEAFLEELFLKGEYEAVVTYESSIIHINQQLKAQGKEPLYAIYPVDGVSIADSPFAYIDKKNASKKEVFTDLQTYILSNEGQKKLQEKGRRTWYGGISNEVDKSVFNPEWGMDTTKYISPIKYPSTEVIKLALSVYQAELRKPIHVAFCLDYSGSMNGNGYVQLVSAMQYIFTDASKEEYLQFSSKDKIDVIPFGTKVLSVWNTNNGSDTLSLLTNIQKLKPAGSTALYPAAMKALEIVKDEDMETYNTSIILMTDGKANVGNYRNLETTYRQIGKEIPIYSIMFGNADPNELQEIAELTNAKVFDGKSDLVKAFKEVRGYN